MTTLVDELRDLLSEAAHKGPAKPGDVHTRVDGDYEKQRDGSWRRLPSGHGKPVAYISPAVKRRARRGRLSGATPKVATPTGATSARETRAAEAFRRVLGTTSPEARDARHPATVRGVGWVPGAGPWKAKAVGLPESTWIAHFNTDRKSPEYNTPITEERKRLHEEIYDAFLTQTPSVSDNEQPVAIVTMGLPASGKSSAIQALAIDSRQFVPADADLVKNYLPEFQQALDQRAQNAAHIVHDESAYLVERMRERAMAERKCLIADGTGSNFEIWEKLIKDLKSNGYRVHLLMADLPPDQCKERITQRAERTGRYVPPGVVDALAPKIQANFMKLKDLSDTSMLFSTAGGDLKPVYTRIDSDPAAIDDDALYDDFKRKAGVSEAVLMAAGVLRALVETGVSLRRNRASKAPAVLDDAVVAAVALGFTDEAATYDALPRRFAPGTGVLMIADASQAL